jgi:hypothetical protein
MVIERTLATVPQGDTASLEDVLAADAAAREAGRRYVAEYGRCA